MSRCAGVLLLLLLKKKKSSMIRYAWLNIDNCCIVMNP